jgi:hypothetical protein
MGKPSLYVIEPPRIDDLQSGRFCPNEEADSAPSNGQDLPEKKKEDKNLKTENPNGFSSVVDHWIAQAPPLIAHKREPLIAEKPTRKLVENALRAHGYDDVVQAVSNYAIVLGSDDHWLTQKWSMHLFFKQRNAFPMFLPEADPLTNYLNRRSTGRNRGLTFEEILNGGGDDPGTEPRKGLPRAA